MLALLEPLPSMAWSQAATVTGAGAPLALTMPSYAQRLASHERGHVRQIAGTVKAIR